MRLSTEEIWQIDGLAAELGVDRSKALRTLLRLGLAAHVRRAGREKARARRIEAAEAANAAIVEEALKEARAPKPMPASLKRRPGHLRLLTQEEIKAAADRAEQRSRRE